MKHRFAVDCNSMWLSRISRRADAAATAQVHTSTTACNDSPSLLSICRWTTTHGDVIPNVGGKLENGACSVSHPGRLTEKAATATSSAKMSKTSR